MVRPLERLQIELITFARIRNRSRDHGEHEVTAEQRNTHRGGHQKMESFA